ncbi:uncharacterized protein LOC112349210 isoform X2 [Selaginella moellendorffii]|uniref:uncharacterized protein LOC112349210 isoform X2 n=1 Tax=Selaginella moellendorffii TaxID=88036 RepID=UPI000D1CEA24|nr:uncharacterized protein LOC112349210 isoform X2 [Selaginella moellendorffii]|eukprot:XP_024538987.1 uncharacterized protein LOC112349210 isoform X2 [Selaginella moellendorffii]
MAMVSRNIGSMLWRPMGRMHAWPGREEGVVTGVTPCTPRAPKNSSATHQFDCQWPMADVIRAAVPSPALQAVAVLGYASLFFFCISAFDAMGSRFREFEGRFQRCCAR